MDMLIGLVYTALGACIAGASTYFANKQQRKYQMQDFRKNLLLRKYEEIYVGLSDHAEFENEVSMRVVGEVGFGKKFKSEDLNASIKGSKLGMNIRFYAPELLHEYTKIETECAKIGKSVIDLISKPGELSDEEREEIVRGTAIPAAVIGKTARTAQEKLARMVAEQIKA